MDHFLSPSQLSILLVPVHPIKRSKFERYAELVRTHGTIVELKEVPRDARGERAIFSSSPTTPGNLLLTFHTPTTYALSHPHSFLSDLQPHRRIHGLIGIFDSSSFLSPSSLSTALAAFQESLGQLPVERTSAVKLFGFDPSEQQVQEASRTRESEQLVMVPRGEDPFFMRTVMAEFTGEVLREFSNMAAQLESRTSIPTPQPPVAPSPFSFLPHRPSASSTLSSYVSPSSAPAPSSPSPSSTGKPTPNLAPLGIAPPPVSRTALGLWGGSQSGNQDGFLYGSSIASTPALATIPGAAGGAAGPGMGVVDQKARKKVQGRERKLMGDWWLLGGRVGEAIVAYNDALPLLRPSPSDSVWHASALENLCVALVLAALSPSSSPLPSSTSSTPAPAPEPPSTLLSSIPDRLTLAASLYESKLPPLPTTTATGDSQPPQAPLDPDRAHPLVHAECCLRGARFLLAIWEAGGDVSKALRRLSGTEAVVEVEGQQRSPSLRALAPSNPIQRSAIASLLSLAYTPHLASLDLPTRLRLTGEIAGLFGRIGYRRKEAFLLREVAALGAEGVGVGGQGAEGEQGGEGRSMRGNEALVRVAERVCGAFGVEVVPRSNSAGGKEARRRTLLQRDHEDDGHGGEEGGRSRFGWPALQVGVLRDCIGIAEALPDYQSAIRFTVTALRSLSATMPPSEQYDLSQNIPRIFAAATRRGAAFELEYWGPGRLVMSLEVAPLSQNRQPFEHPYQDVSSNAQSSIISPLNKRDPFIYNPKKLGASAAKIRPTLVQNEPAEIFVTLQNPFLFGLDVQSIEMSTSGVDFASEPLSTTIPPGSFHTVRLRGTPLQAGLLSIRGCFIRLAGCTSREFLLPVWDDQEELKRAKAASLDTRRDRVKRSGFDAFERREEEREGEKEEGLRYLECAVVPEMPMLWMRSTSLTHGALMLYDGEISTIRIALENTSSSPVDFVKLTFSDMHTTTSEAYVADNELAPGDAYEIEAENLHRPVFRWSSEEKPLILPGSSTVLEVKCLGKVGCGSGTIQLDYGFTDRPAVKSSGIFHTRQLFCDIFMTVHRALVAHSLDILRLKALPEAATAHGRSASVAHLGRRGAALDQRLEESLKDVDDGEHCLVSVDVMNAYGKPFEVKVERCEDGNDFYQVRQLIEPGATLRMLLRLDRIVISPEQLAQPIPSLSNRQFVVAKVKQSAEDERLSRELFWYREELLQRIRASWNEVGSLRSGSISLRGLQLTKPMLDILRGDDVDIQLHLDDNASAEPGAFHFQGRGQRLVYSAMANEFIDICATIENNSASTLHLSLRLELRPPESTRATPAALAHLARYVVIEGVSPVSVPALEPGESQTVRVSICLLAEGQYELGCVVEERRSALEWTEARERRSYGAREPLAISVDR